LSPDFDSDDLFSSPMISRQSSTHSRQDGYTKTFLPEAQKAIKEHGGVYLGGGFDKTTNLTGGGSMSEPPPNRVVLIKFENADTAKKWWDTDGKKTNEIGAKFAN